MFLLSSSSSVALSAADTKTRCHQSPNRIANGGQRVSELMARRHSSFFSSSSLSAKVKNTKKKEHKSQQKRIFGKSTIKALVSVDVGPAAVLGTSLMLSSIALYQIRATRPEVSRDKDVFFSSVGLLCGGILVFQGWRLDPLMLFGQLMTAGTAIAFASETIGLRQNLLEVEEERGYDGIGDDEEDDDDYDLRRRRSGRRGGGSGTGRKRNNNTNRGYALPSQTQSGFRSFDDSFDDLYEDDRDGGMMEQQRRGFTTSSGIGGRYIGTAAAAAAGNSSSFYDDDDDLEEEEEDDERGSDFSREFQRSSSRRRRPKQEEEEQEEENESSPNKPSLDVWGSEGDDVF